MSRPGPRRPSGLSSIGARRPGLLLEPLESRRLLSTSSTSVTNPTPAYSALIPSQIAAAYKISLSPSSGGGETIAIVDAYNDPNIVADLARFDSQYNLPTPSITVMNQYGQTTSLPRTDAGWSLEIALDVEWAHAAAPGAKILLVEANSASMSDLMAAVHTAAQRANVVSMSWGGPEFQGEAAYDTAAYFAYPNVTFVAASGDSGGVSGAEWPAVSPYVVGVGGTTLSLTSSGSISSETAWNGTGSRSSGYSGSGGGTSLYESLPSYQVAALGGGATRRATPDVAAVANPATGLSVYDSVAGAGQTGWFQIGGTSAGSPLWAGIIADADQARASVGQGQLSSAQTLNLLYGLAGSSSYSSDFHDITSGSNFAATAKKGYDMVTGLGSPVVNNLIAASSTYAVSSSVVKSAATTATTTTTVTHAAISAQWIASSASTTVPAGTMSVAVFQPIAPVTINTTTQAPAGLATARASDASSLVSPPRPNQSLPRPALVISSSRSEEGTTIPESGLESPSRPELFLDPETPRAIDEVAPVLAVRAFLPGPPWDAAVDRYLSEEAESAAFAMDPPQVLAGKPETEAPTSPSHAVLAGLAVAIWGTWEYRSRRSDRDPRRWSPARSLPAV